VAGLIDVVCKSVDADTLVLAVVMFLSFFGLNWRIGQQERLVRDNLNNGVRGDIKRLDVKIDLFATQLATLQGEHNARHHQ
jgi:hypothetical protein